MKIVATGPIAPPTEEILGGLGEIVVAPASDEETLLPLVDDAVALIVRGGGWISGRLIDAAPALRVIGRSGVGFDEIDLEAANRRRIPVVITPNANAQAVAEAALAMLLCLVKGIVDLDRLVREGRWGERDQADVRDLEGATLGIVGLGRIGGCLAELVRPFGMRVLGYDPYVESAEGVELVDLEVLFQEADYLSLHAPLTAETRGMVDARLLSLAGPGAILVNLARGGLVRSLDDLLGALESGALHAVGLDVFEPEPPDLSHPIFRHPRVLLSPHALGVSRLAKRRIFEEMSLGIAAVLRGGRPASVANPEIYGEEAPSSRP
jgi:phosphoglycerate dehydrogenase-like enzyme